MLERLEVSKFRSSNEVSNIRLSDFFLRPISIQDDNVEQKEGQDRVVIRKHHVEDIMRQVNQGRPESTGGSFVTDRMREANAYLVRAILSGAEIFVVENKPDMICKGCRLVSTCEYSD